MTLTLEAPVREVVDTLPACVRCEGSGMHAHGVCSACQGFGCIVDTKMAGVLYLTAVRAAERRSSREGDARRQLKRCQNELDLVTGRKNTPYNTSEGQLRRQLHEVRAWKSKVFEDIRSMRRLLLEARAEIAELREQLDAAKVG